MLEYNIKDPFKSVFGFSLDSLVVIWHVPQEVRTGYLLVKESIIVLLNSLQNSECFEHLLFIGEHPGLVVVTKHDSHQ